MAARPAPPLQGEVDRLREALERIAEGSTPPHQNGHYLQARAAVMIARAAVTPSESKTND